MEFFGRGVLIFMKFFRCRPILFKVKPIFDGSLQGWMPAGLKIIQVTFPQVRGQVTMIQINE